MWVAAFGALAVWGGALVTWAFQAAKDACESPIAAVSAARLCALAQNLGLTLGAALNCGVALASR